MKEREPRYEEYENFISNDKSFENISENIKHKIERSVDHDFLISLFDLDEVIHDKNPKPKDEDKLRSANAQLTTENTTLRTEVGVLKSRLETAQNDISELQRRDINNQVTLAELRRKNEELERQKSKTPEGINPLDPMGYLQTLGINPEEIRRLTAEQAQAYIKAIYRTKAPFNHPDAIGEDDEFIRKLNVAYDFLKKPANRWYYGK